MERDEQVTNLELSKKLKELGVKQDSYWAWIIDNERALDMPFWLVSKDGSPTINEKYGKSYIVANGSIKAERVEEVYSAFSVAELGVLLGNDLERIKRDNNSFCWVKQVNGNGVNQYNTSEADTRGNLLIYLLENNLIGNIEN